ncbi:uncharacterized protein [Epargyreus clarus]|uniref:uncharacterized protein n=1 Tax=Epargyreus clarus TaxID=520877 RepID=UPI003C2EA292
MSNEIEKLTRETLVSVDHDDLLANVKLSIESTIKTEISKLNINTHRNDKVNKASPSYAQVASTRKSSPSRVHKPVSKPSIIVYPTSEDNNRQQVAEKWRKSIHFKEVNYAPAGIQPVGRNKLRVEFDTADQRDETLKRLESSTDIRAEPSRKLRPMVILKGVYKDTPVEELTELIVKQNAEVYALQPGPDDLQFRFERRNKNNKLYNAVFITSPSTWKKLMELGRINVNHQRIHVEEFVPLLQCYKCLQFGHLKKYCSSEVGSCSHCGEDNHTLATCPARNEPEKINCYNCNIKNHKLNIMSDTRHSPTSDNCPLREAMRDRVQGKIDYGL